MSGLEFSYSISNPFLPVVPETAPPPSFTMSQQSYVSDALALGAAPPPWEDRLDISPEITACFLHIFPSKIKTVISDVISWLSDY